MKASNSSLCDLLHLERAGLFWTTSLADHSIRALSISLVTSSSGQIMSIMVGSEMSQPKFTNTNTAETHRILLWLFLASRNRRPAGDTKLLSASPLLRFRLSANIPWSDTRLSSTYQHWCTDLCKSPAWDEQVCRDPFIGRFPQFMSELLCKCLDTCFGDVVCCS